MNYRTNVVNFFFFGGGEALIGEGLLFRKSYFLEGHSSERGAYQRVGAYQRGALIRSFTVLYSKQFFRYDCTTIGLGLVQHPIIFQILNMEASTLLSISRPVLFIHFSRC